MAGIESAWGTSRFSKEGNNLFGIRTWDLESDHMKPKDVPNAKFGLKKYLTKCDSIKDMIRILNTHTAYTDFRVERKVQLKKGTWDYDKLLILLHAWSTNPDYAKIILRTIKERELP
jgi:Bax protein